MQLGSSAFQGPFAFPRCVLRPSRVPHSAFPIQGLELEGVVTEAGDA